MNRTILSVLIMGTLLGGCSSTPKDEHDPTKEMSRFEAEQLRTKNETMELLTNCLLYTSPSPRDQA